MINCDILVLNLVCHLAAVLPVVGVSLNEEKCRYGSYQNNLNKRKPQNTLISYNVAIYSFTSKHELRLQIAEHIHTLRWRRPQHCLSTLQRHLMSTSTEFISQSSAPTIFTSFDFHDLVKGRVSDVNRFMSRHIIGSQLGPDHPIMSMVITSDVPLCLATCQKSSRKY